MPFSSLNSTNGFPALQLWLRLCRKSIWEPHGPAPASPLPTLTASQHLHLPHALHRPHFWQPQHSPQALSLPTLVSGVPSVSKPLTPSQSHLNLKCLSTGTTTTSQKLSLSSLLPQVTLNVLHMFSQHLKYSSLNIYVIFYCI